MPTATSTPTATQPTAPARRDGDVLDRLVECAGASGNVESFLRSALVAISEHFSARLALITLTGVARSINERCETGPTSSFLERACQGTLLESETSGDALARLYTLDGSDHRLVILSVPLRHDQHGHGGVGLVASCKNGIEARQHLFELRCLASAVVALASSVDRPHVDSNAGLSNRVQRALSKSSAFTSLTEMAFAITNNVKTKYSCDLVALGRVAGRRVKILSLSGMDSVYPRSPGSRLIRQAMEECLDYEHLVASQAGGQWSDTDGGLDFRLHRQWRSGLGEAAVASVPLMARDECVAVVSMTRPGGTGFRESELKDIEQQLEVYGPALQLVARANRRWPAQTRDALLSSLSWLMARDGWGRRVICMSLLLLMTWFAFGTMGYQLSTPCQIVATERRHMAAPFQGQVKAAFVEPGDIVRRGQLLFVMETRELLLQKREIEAELAMTRLEVSQAITDKKLKQAALSRAQMDVLNARLEGVQRRIAVAEVRAPMDGRVQTGNVKRLIGSVVPLGESLITFAPTGKWAVELLVPDTDIQAVSVGQRGHFVTIARPGREIPCQVERMEPTAIVKKNQNVFAVRARVSGAAKAVRVGTEGVATIQVGRRRVSWIALHRVIRFLRLHFWM